MTSRRKLGAARFSAVAEMLSVKNRVRAGIAVTRRDAVVDNDFIANAFDSGNTARGLQRGDFLPFGRDPTAKKSRAINDRDFDALDRAVSDSLVYLEFQSIVRRRRFTVRISGRAFDRFYCLEVFFLVSGALLHLRLVWGYGRFRLSRFSHLCDRRNILAGSLLSRLFLGRSRLLGRQSLAVLSFSTGVCFQSSRLQFSRLN